MANYIIIEERTYSTTCSNRISSFNNVRYLLLHNQSIIRTKRRFIGMNEFFQCCVDILNLAHCLSDILDLCNALCNRFIIFLHYQIISRWPSSQDTFSAHTNWELEPVVVDQQNRHPMMILKRNLQQLPLYRHYQMDSFIRMSMIRQQYPLEQTGYIIKYKVYYVLRSRITTHRWSPGWNRHLSRVILSSLLGRAPQIRPNWRNWKWPSRPTKLENKYRIEFLPWCKFKSGRSPASIFTNLFNQSAEFFQRCIFPKRSDIRFRKTKYGYLSHSPEERLH